MLSLYVPPPPSEWNESTAHAQQTGSLARSLSQAIQSLATGEGGGVIVTVLAHRRVMISST